MTKHQRWLTAMMMGALLAACAGGACGCGGGSDGQSTPEGVVRKMTTAVVEMDKEDFVACLTGTPTEMRAANAFMDFLVAGKEFKEAMIEAYGEKAWADFQDPRGARLTTEVTDNRGELHKVKYDVKGDTAVCTFPEGSQRIHLVRKDGRWYVQVRDIITAKGPLEKATEFWEKTAAFIRRSKARIGKPGVTAESLDDEMGRGFMKIMTSR